MARYESFVVHFESFVVHFANGQGDRSFSSLDEARRVIEHRAGYDPPPPGIFPAEIWQRTYVDLALADERLAERYPPAP
jgi:hypothetical protein